MWVSYENWMHIAGNCYGEWLDHHRVSIGTDHGMTFCMSGTSAYSNSWNAMASNCGRTDIDGIQEICKLCGFVA